MSTPPASPPSRIPRRVPSMPAGPETTERPSSRCLSRPAPLQLCSKSATPHARKSSTSSSHRSVRPSPTTLSPSSTLAPSYPSSSKRSSTHSSSSTLAPHRTPPRPKMLRPSSDHYTTFDLRPPMSPGEEPQERSGWISQWWNGGQRASDEEAGEREPLVPRTGPATIEGGKDGLPKLSRECLVAEIKCYGSYMLPPILFFVVFVLGLSLWVYHNARKEP